MNPSLPNMKMSPYHQFPEDPEIAKRLVPIKEAAAARQCAETTLRNNAKARRLRAYQRQDGAPVCVLLEEVDEFLQRRPDIQSVFHPEPEPFDSFGCQIRSIPTASATGSTSAPPLKCLEGVSHEVISIVAECLNEVAEVLLSDRTHNPKENKK